MPSLSAPALSVCPSVRGTCSENLRGYSQEGIRHHRLRVQRDVQLAGDVPVDVGANVFQLISWKQAGRSQHTGH